MSTHSPAEQNLLHDDRNADGDVKVSPETETMLMLERTHTHTRTHIFLEIKQCQLFVFQQIYCFILNKDEFSSGLCVFVCVWSLLSLLSVL